MKRDMDLIRKILLAVEKSEPTARHIDLTLMDHEQAEVDYHAYLLWEAGLCEGIDTTHIGSKWKTVRINRLTWAGHEFLDAARSETRWRKAMGMVKSTAGTVGIGILTQVLTKLAKDELGLG